MLAAFQRRLFHRAGFSSAQADRLVSALEATLASQGLHVVISLANTTSADGDVASGTALPHTPVGDVSVRVNGLEAELGLDCYFETAPPELGARLLWRGDAAGYQLDGTDVISFTYGV
jgi:hypothetical protein